jgi:hypothetical protein
MYRLKIKTKEEVEIKCSKPKQQTEAMNTKA